MLCYIYTTYNIYNAICIYICIHIYIYINIYIYIYVVIKANENTATTTLANYHLII